MIKRQALQEFRALLDQGVMSDRLPVIAVENVIYIHAEELLMLLDTLIARLKPSLPGVIHD